MYQLNPISDQRWPDFLNRHPHAHVFHTPGWLQALQRTYGFLPIAFTTSPATSDLNNGIAFCHVDSWITGKRLVSVPFSDHCDPLFHNPDDLNQLASDLGTECARGQYKYVELRPRMTIMPGSSFYVADRFLLHRLDLTPNIDDLFHGFDESCIRRRIRHASKENLAYEQGRSESMVREFFRLMVMTRQRHQLPPQPIEWFFNIVEFLGPAATIHLIRKDTLPIAAILTLGYKRSLVMKYSCLDENYKKLGPMPLLLWEVIQYAKQHDYLEFDLGRCDIGDQGLATFKTRLGAVASELSYWRHTLTGGAQQTHSGRDSQLRVAKRLFMHMPRALLVASGRVLYKHFA